MLRTVQGNLPRMYNYWYIIILCRQSPEIQTYRSFAPIAYTFSEFITFIFPEKRKASLCSS